MGYLMTCALVVIAGPNAHWMYYHTHAILDCLQLLMHKQYQSMQPSCSFVHVLKHSHISLLSTLRLFLSY